MAIPRREPNAATPRKTGTPLNPQDAGARARDLVTTLYEEVLNGGNYDLVNDLIAPGFTDDDPALPPDIGTGPAAFSAVLGAMATAVPDARFTIDEMVGEGNRVVVRWTVGNGDFTNSGVSIYLTDPEAGQILTASTRWDAATLERHAGDKHMAALHRGRPSQPGSAGRR